MLHGNYVREWIGFSGLNEEEKSFASRHLATSEQRLEAVRSLLKDGHYYLDCPGGATAEAAKYQAERQSQGLYDFWHFAAVYYALSTDENAAEELCSAAVKLEGIRPEIR